MIYTDFDLSDGDFQDAVDIMKLINKEISFINNNSDRYDRLWYNYAWREISIKWRFKDIIPWSAELVSFTPINVHDYQNQRIWNIITFFASEKTGILSKTKEMFYIWYEGWNFCLRYDLSEYSDRFLQDTQKAIIDLTEEFNKRTANHIAILMTEFKLRDHNKKTGDFYGVAKNSFYPPEFILVEKENGLIDKTKISEWYFASVWFKIGTVNPITKNYKVEEYNEDQLAEIFLAERETKYPYNRI